MIISVNKFHVTLPQCHTR